MRWYLPNIARFPSVDPLTEKFPNESCFIFAGDNPIMNNDVKGGFKFPANKIKEYKEKYPYFYSYIESGFGNLIVNSKTIQSSLLKYTVGALSLSQIRQDIVFDGESTPTIELSKKDPAQGGLYNHSTRTIELNITRIEEFEAIMAENNSHPDKKLAALIGITKTLLNEYTHYGDGTDGLDAIQGPNGSIINADPTISQEGCFGDCIFDEGNEAVSKIYGNDDSSKDASDRTLYLKRNGQMLIENDEKEIEIRENNYSKSQQDKSVIPTLPQKSTNPLPKRAID